MCSDAQPPPPDPSLRPSGGVCGYGCRSPTEATKLGAGKARKRNQGQEARERKGHGETRDKGKKAEGEERRGTTDVRKESKAYEGQETKGRTNK